MLVEHSDGSMRYVPVASKVKLNKKRKANVEMGEDGEPQRGANHKADHILIAPRGMAPEDLTHMQAKVAGAGLRHRIPESEVVFKSKESLTDGERQAAQILKAAFRS